MGAITPTPDNSPNVSPVNIQSEQKEQSVVSKIASHALFAKPADAARTPVAQPEGADRKVLLQQEKPVLLELLNMKLTNYEALCKVVKILRDRGDKLKDKTSRAAVKIHADNIEALLPGTLVGIIKSGFPEQVQKNISGKLFTQRNEVGADLQRLVDLNFLRDAAEDMNPENIVDFVLSYDNSQKRGGIKEILGRIIELKILLNRIEAKETGK